MQLFTDNVKEVELFLLNRGMSYETGEKRFRINDEMLPVPTFTLQGETAEIRLAVFDTDDLRKNAAAGKAPDRAKIRQVEAILAIA